MKRMISLILAVVMVLALLPAAAFAVEPSRWDGDSRQYFGWNVASSIAEGGSANPFEEKAAYDAIAGSVDVYVGQLSGEVTEETIAAAAAEGTLTEMPVGGFYGGEGSTRYTPELSDWTISRINEKGLIVVARNGLAFERSSICCNDVYGFNCQTAARGNAGDFNDAIVSGETRILVITPEMLAEDGVYHQGRGHAWLMLSLAGTTEFSIIYNVRENADEAYELDNTVTLAAGAPVEAYAPTAPEGYVFSGWYTDPELTQPWDQPEKMPSNDIVVYGQFQPRGDLHYIVHYYIENTTIPVARDKIVRNQTLGATVTETAIEVRDFIALEPVEQTITLTGDGMEIIFYYTIDRPEMELEKGEHFNYIVGYEDGTVRPAGQITRAEVAAIFFRLMTEESRNALMTTENPFSDVQEGQWFNVAVSTLTNAGILNGYPDGTFKPGRAITRAELAKVIALFAELKEGTIRFCDVRDHWARAYIELAAGNGWIYGYPDGTFRPDNNLNRAETITMLNRVLRRDVRQERHLIDGMVTFSDNMDTRAWYYFHIQEATNYHKYTRIEPYSTEEKWLELIENIDWTDYQY